MNLCVMLGKTRENSRDEKRTLAKFSFVYINTFTAASAVKKRSQLDGDGLFENNRAREYFREFVK